MSCRQRSSASMARLCDIVHSSHTISLHCCNIAPRALFLLMLHVGVSSLARLKGNLKTECAIRPPLSYVAVIPQEATANATLRSVRFARKFKNLYRWHGHRGERKDGAGRTKNEVRRKMAKEWMDNNYANLHESNVN
ncbi:hypothetical protein TNCV_3401781 [Trichonephila clavipes]|nr:hypothetical protein TNCV_3401781 [Trichonephila clavipes]